MHRLLCIAITVGIVIHPVPISIVNHNVATATGGQQWGMQAMVSCPLSTATNKDDDNNTVVIAIMPHHHPPPPLSGDGGA